MKLACSVSVYNRILPASTVHSNTKYVKSTLALCKSPKCEAYCVILFSNQNKNGTKYNLRGNVNQILTRFINEGKATIQFKYPPLDLYIQADVIQLKAFLHLIKRVLENKISAKELTCSSMSVTPIATKDLPPKKLCIRKRSDYPSKGFPKSLEALYINNIRRCSLDKGIVQLFKLRILDLSNNLIENLPEEFSTLPCLSELNVSSNCFHKSSPKQWSWMGGNLSKTLYYLDLQSNHLQYLPDQIVKLYNLANLIISNNELKSLPSGIGNLNKLKILLAGNNQLTILPGSARMFRLQSLDLCNNNFDTPRPNNLTNRPYSVWSLKETAASTVLCLRITYNADIIPFSLVRYLDYAKYCICGRACFEEYLRSPQLLLLDTIARSFVLSSGGIGCVPIDCYYCSLKCFQSTNRYRKPVI